MTGLYNVIYSICDRAPPHGIDSASDSLPVAIYDANSGLLYMSLDASLANLFLRLFPPSFSALIHCIDVYIDNFISLAWAGPLKQRQLQRCLFAAINRIFRPNDRRISMRQEPNFLKISIGGAMHGQHGNISWGGLVYHHISLPPTRLAKVRAFLADFLTSL